MSIIPDNAKVRIKAAMQVRDPWAHVTVTKVRVERTAPGYDPYNHIGRAFPAGFDPRRYSK